MKKRIIFSVFGIVFVFGASIAFAGATMTAQLANRPIFQSLSRMTSSTIQEIRDMNSLYEVVAQNRQNRRTMIFYVTKDEQYIIGGTVYDRNSQNITQARIQEVDKVDISQFPLQDAIVTKKGTGAKKLVLFTDVDCPYCRRANDWLLGQDNYTLYTYLFPLEQIHPQSHSKSTAIFRAIDENAAIQAAFHDKDINAFIKKNMSQEQAEKKLAKHILTAQMVDMQGTPLFILPNGKKISGFDQRALEDFFR